MKENFIGANREGVISHIKNKYGAQKETLWIKYPNYAVFRHENGKWFAVIMDKTKNKLGKRGGEKVDILNVKCNYILQNSLLQEEGFFQAYHMNKNNWITILLDGSVDENKVYELIDLSFSEVGRSKK